MRIEFEVGSAGCKGGVVVSVIGLLVTDQDQARCSGNIGKLVQLYVCKICRRQSSSVKRSAETY